MSAFSENANNSLTTI